MRKITSIQLFMLLFVSRIFNTMNYMPIFSDLKDIPAFMVGAFISIFVFIIMLIPAYFYFKKFDNNILSSALIINKPLGIIFSCFFAFEFFSSIVGTVWGLEYFLQNAVFPKASVFFLVLLICLFTFYSVKYGFEALCRSSTIIFVLLIIGILIIVLCSIPNVNLTNIKPISSSIINQIPYQISLTYELPLFIFFFSSVKKEKNAFINSSLLFIIISSITMIIINFIIMGVLGNYSYVQTFPYYTIASISKVSILQRLDAIHILLWVFMCFTRICLFIFATKKSLDIAFPKLKFKTIAIFILTVILSTILCYHPEIIKKITAHSGISVTVMATIVPLFILVRRKKLEKIIGNNNVHNNDVSYDIVHR
ncbi:MAG: GerAB/ArcD/ProY family transporter [Oscillospiraceae bacterium]